MKKKLIFLASVMMCTLGVMAQSLATRLDSLFKVTTDRQMFNGNVLVAEDGRIIYQKSFGYADFEQQRLNDRSTGFQLASLSKVFTALAVLQQYEKGRLKLDDPFSKYFPAFPYKDITIRGLLSHTSGLSDQDLDAAFTDFETKSKRRPANQDFVPIIASARVKLKLAPGQKWWYCNLGYELLATLVEKTSGQPFENYLRHHIWVPANMKDTYLKMPGISAKAAKANNYDYETRYSPVRIRVDLNKPDYTEQSFGHSNIVSTTGDLLKLDQALYKGLLLKKSTIDLATTPDKLKDGSDNTVWMNIGGMGKALDGLGWFIFKDQSAGKTSWHAGGMQGAVTILLRNTDRKQTVILLDNTGSEGIYKTALNALHILNNQPLVPNKKNLSRIYGRALLEGGMDHGMTLLQSFKPDTANYNLTEDDINNLGYALIASRHQAEGLEALKVNCLLYPLSDNVFNSYAEALAGSGKKQEAILMYRRSLALNPKNEDSQKALQALLK
ncbi:serine hydrolase domain-containing protein [Mucilaginibacter sp. KACC 22063]|uniref:serine hydrolase domain-containing protein n=1 Tax=Mucilaginibacter sp. KACC 22063 TaxID=3025666 RepID=UPI00236710B8|nr:serine hydrolase domain-containing protein [Mucilaginibacter sp. KACC 22063]WDF57178.1 serine hydrolase [Mucilaginibacter sp. KACC 22063]